MALRQPSEQEGIVLLELEHLALHGAGGDVDMDFVAHRAFLVASVITVASTNLSLTNDLLIDRRIKSRDNHVHK